MQFTKELTTVTPFTKYFAMILFIVIPISTFFLGMQYARRTFTESISSPLPTEIFRQPTVFSLSPPAFTQATSITDPNYPLVAESKQAILNSGISAPYFAQHFTLAKAYDQDENRRVDWILNVGEWQFGLTDSIGFYTNDAGQRVNIHSIKNDLQGVHEFITVITKIQANNLMSNCLTQNNRNINDFTFSATYVPKIDNINPYLAYVATSLKSFHIGGPLGPDAKESVVINLESGQCTPRLISR